VLRLKSTLFFSEGAFVDDRGWFTGFSMFSFALKGVKTNGKRRTSRGDARSCVPGRSEEESAQRGSGGSTQQKKA
jgi:hypothetical protein